MEVLMGGPSSPGGLRRFEWTRPRAATANETVPAKPEGGWTAARAILPFSHPDSVSQFSVHPAAARPITLVLTGTHCAGKATLGKRTAQVLGWIFQPELGEVLRGATIVPGGHRDGYKFDNSQYQSWDDHVHRAEVQRDDVASLASSSHRVVETWHLGNLAWARWRQHKGTNVVVNNEGNDKDDDHGVDAMPYWDAAQSHARKAVVLCVHLRVSAKASLRRRRCSSSRSSKAAGAERLPLERESEECHELHVALGVEGERLLLQQVPSRLPSVPTLVLDNSSDGEAAMQDTTRSIVQFVNENLWRTVA